MTVQEQLAFRQKIIDDAVRLRRPERVPHMSNFALWPVLDYGVPLSVGCSDWELMEKIQRRFLETYQFDTPGFQGALLCNPPRMLDRIGQSYNIFNDEEGHVSLTDFDLMAQDDYDDYIASLPDLVWNKLLPRKFENWGSVTVGDFASAIEEFGRFGEYMQRIMTFTPGDYGIPNTASMMVFPTIEFLINSIRGIKGTARDMRIIPDKVAEACDKLDPDDAALDAIYAALPAEAPVAFDMQMVFLGNNFLSLEQWERYEWPIVKRVIDAAVRADKTVYIFAEGVISRFYEYFRQVPAGHVAIHIEQDDVFDFRENLPNVCVVGGMSTHLLGSGTPKQCVDHAKHLIDELGGDGGFILSQDKMMSYMRDADPENLKAVCDFAADYRP